MFFWNRRQRRKAHKLNRGVRETRFRRLGYEGLEGRLLLTGLVVSNLNDSGSGSLRAAVATANTDAKNGVSDSITFSISGSITLTTGQLELGAAGAGSGVITIDGAGAVAISGNDASRVFQVDAGITASLTALTIVHGNASVGASHSGAGILNNGTLTVANSTFSSNVAIDFGGAIANLGTMTVTNATIIDNTGTGVSGGGIYNSGMLTVTSSTFARNSALSRGGAVDNDGGGSTTITSSTFAGNSAPNGGAVTNVNSSFLTITTSTFTSNTATNEGGAIRADVGALTLVNSTLSGNSAAKGGGILISTGSVTLVNTIVAGNTVGTVANGPNVNGAILAASTSNLIGDGTAMTGITNGSNGNQVGTTAIPIDPKLGPLANNGGPNQSLALLAGSPSINAGGSVTTLSTAISTTSATSITVVNASTITRTAGSFLIQIDSEQMLVTNVSGNTLTVTRGANGTTPNTHSSGVGVVLVLDQLGNKRVNTADIGAFEYQELGDATFELPSIGSGTFGYNLGTTPWTFTGAAGISANGSALTAGNSSAPQGAQVAFVQSTGSMTVTVGVAAGNYVISFLAAQRGNYNIGNQSIQILVDGIVADTVTPLGNVYIPYAVISLALAAGNHTITFQGMSTSDATAFIDLVSVTAATVSSGQFGDLGFQAVSVGAGAFAYDPSGSVWSFSGLSGVSGNGSAFTSANPNAPEGSQVGFLQENGSIVQAVNLTTTGNYVISFLAAQRATMNAGNQTIQVLVDGVLLDSITPSGTYYAPYAVITTTLASGSHTVTFKGLALVDSTALIDRVNIALATPTNGQFGDAGFQNVVVGVGSFQYDPAGSAWTFSGASGVSANASGFTNANPNAPEGTQVGFLQGNGTVAQVVNLTSANNYAISFLAAQRGSGNTANQTIQVVVDGIVRDTVTPSGTSYAPYAVIVGPLSVGNHAITFKGLSNSDATALIDQVSFTVVSVTSAQFGDSGFQSVNVGAGNSRYDPAGSAWTFSGSAGVSNNGSGFTSGNANAPELDQVGFLQSTGQIAQIISIATAGNYVISFQAAQRGNYNQGNQSIQVLIDGAVLATFTPSGSGYLPYAFITPVTSGNHTIILRGLATTDATALIDQVKIAAATSTSNQFGDPGFESVSLGTGVYRYDPTGSAWTFSGTAGVSDNASSFTSGNPIAPAGSQVGFLQSAGSISQVVTLTTGGNYAISLSAAQRGTLNKENQSVQISVDGTVLFTIKPTSKNYVVFTSAPVFLAAGAHIIVLQGLATTDSTALLDSLNIAGIS